jgi:large subunit ribosomal protein L6
VLRIEEKEARENLSRIGKKPIPIPKGVKVSLEDRRIVIEGPRGTSSKAIPGEIQVVVEGDAICVRRSSDAPRQRASHGLTRSLIANMVEGVTGGFEKELEIVGVGYRVEAKKDGINLQLGLSHPVFLRTPEGVEFEVVNPTQLKVKGIDKEIVGRTADRIKKLRPPEPYKGKGIRYKGEHVRRKAGKTAM